MSTPITREYLDALAARLLAIKGHETYAYGQGSYEGDGCRTCHWQGPPGSAQAHRDETRLGALVEVLDAALAGTQTDDGAGVAPATARVETGSQAVAPEPAPSSPEQWSLPVSLCPAHHLAEPCPTCAAYIAAGL